MADAMVEGFRLSPQQKHLWMLYPSTHGSTPFRALGRVAITGELVPAVLEAAVQRVIARHEILRTTFRFLPGVTLPVQVVSSRATGLDMTYDLSDREPQQQHADLDRLADQLRRYSFDLQNGPLCIVWLVRLAADRHVLLLALPALCADRRSLHNIVRELEASYGAALGQGAPENEPVQYADIAEWQSDLLESSADDQQQRWRDLPLAALAHTRLPFERVSADPHVFLPRIKRAALPAAVAQRLAHHAREHGTSLDVFLLACWQLLLARLLGQPQLLVGVTVAGRGFQELEDALGSFAKIVPIVAPAQAQLRFDQLAAQTERALDQARAEQQYFSWDAHTRSAQGPLSLPFSFEFQELPPGETDAPVSFALIEQYVCGDRFKIKLDCIQRADAIALEWHYDANLFDPDDIRRIAAEFETLVTGIADHPDRDVRSYALCSSAELHQLLLDFNASAMPYDRQRPVHRIFEERARQYPDAVAVVYEGQRLTYAQLNRKANQLARHLRHHELRPETRVAIFLDRSLDLIVSILAVLKASGTYVPIDPMYPPERAGFMLCDAAARVVITHGSLAATLPVGTARVVDLAADWERIAAEDDADLSAAVAAENLAYLIYTSGSTGQPKGVMIEHAAITNLVAGLHASIYADYAPGQRVALIASCAFDASVQQIFGALLQGHRLYIVPDEVKRDGAALWRYFQRHAIAISDGTPAMIALLLDAQPAAEGVLPVRHFIIGGEELPLTIATQFAARVGPHSTITNIYGPAECCVDSTAYRIDPTSLSTLTSVPIGRPLANKQVYILDEHLRPVPIGAPGDIYIAGDGLGRGYTGRPDLTAERFIPRPDWGLPIGDVGLGEPQSPIPNPQSPIPNRLYRTGDIGRWRPDGAIEFLGRSDSQVKIRGFRIELGEVEAALRRLSAVREAVVVVKGRGKTAADAPIRVCKRCFLTSIVPHTTIDDQGVCNLCRDFDLYRDKFAQYFKTTDDLVRLRDQVRARSTGDYDCLLLYSGGKDSTYALLRLVALGFRVLTFTFDNGYISPAAFSNIERICRQLNVENVRVGLDSMRQVFAESLRLDSSVCTGCFKAITSLSTKLALERQIPIVVTALSRGQIYETKLANFLRQRTFAVSQMEQDLTTYRKLYHSTNDAISQLIRDDVLADEAAFDRIHFVDFFRYVDVREDEILAALQAQDGLWAMPTDTGLSSSNCLINDLGVHLHLRNKGYHYYADQFSWEVRIGHMSYERALEELSYTVDQPRFDAILHEIQYQDVDPASRLPESYLCAYVIAAPGTSVSELRDDLSRTLPDYMVPATFVFCDSFPVTTNGKIDRDALPDPDGERPNLSVPFVAPTTAAEQRVTAIWQEVLGLRKIGIHDSFFELGGHSLLATQLVARIRQAFQIDLPLRALFDCPDVASLTRQIEELIRAQLVEQLASLSEAEASELLRAR